MRNHILSVWGATLVGLAGLAASAIIPGEAQKAFANGKPKAPVVQTGAQPVPYNADHQSIIRVTDRDALPVTRGVRIGRHKAIVVELPRDLRDVVVSAPDLVDAVVQSSNRVHLISKGKPGQSNAFFFDASGEQILTLEISIEHDTAVLEALYRRLMPSSNIKAEILNETVILTGTVRSPVDSDRAFDIASRFIVWQDPQKHERHDKKVINMLAVEGEEQVMLRVTVAEVQRSLLKQFGINIAADINAGNFVTSIMTSNALPLTAAAGLGTMPVPGFNPKIDDKNLCAGVTCMYATGPKTDTFGNSGTTSNWRSGNQNFSNAMRAMERDGLVKTLAEPNLTAVSGEAAKFLAGGEYPVPVVDEKGSMSVIYKEFGIGLAFTPIVMSEGRISLKIETEVSELSSDGAVTLSNISIPGLKKRQAKSTIELPSGGSLAIAGLISEDTRQNIDGMPGLKNIPVLGTLFRSRDFIKSETELVVIVTPYAVRPTSRANLARPIDGLGDPTDMKANFLGHINRIYGRSTLPPSGGLKGDYGFIVE